MWAGIERIREQEGCIVEGIYTAMAARLLDRADLLVWVHPPWEVCSRSLVDREARRPIPERTRTNDISCHGHQRLFEGFTGAKPRFSREAVNAFVREFEARSASDAAAGESVRCPTSEDEASE